MSNKKFFLALICVLILSIEFDYSIVNLNTSTQRQINLILLALVSFLSRKRLSRKLTTLSKPIILYLTYFSFCLISIVWSLAPNETISSLVGIIITIITAFNIVYRYSYSEFLKSFLNVLTFTIILSWVLFFLGFTEYTLNKEDFFRFKGIYIHTQRVSLLASLALIVIWSNIIRIKKKYLIVYTIIMLLTLLSTQARAFTTFTIIVLLFIYLDRTDRRKAVLTISIFIAVLLSLSAEIFAIIERVYQRGDADITELTGRTEVWSTLIPIITEKPIMGYGFGAFKIKPVVLYSYVPEHAHNIWLHQVYETGLIGSIIFTVFLIKCYKASRNFRKSNKAALVDYLILFVLLSGLTGVPLGANTSPLYIFLITTILYESFIKRIYLIKKRVSPVLEENLQTH